MIFINFAIFYFALLLAAVPSSQKLSKIKTNGKWFVDQNNRTIIFRGINAVQKSFPWLPNQDSHVNLSNLTTLSWYKKFGYNVVRLGYMWSGLFPEKGKMNQTYVDEMGKIIDTLESYGMYVIIDLHQDMMSSKFGSYDGVPRWVIDEMPKSKHEFPWPFKKDPGGFTEYITEACGFAFQCLYDNINNFQTYFEQFWTTVAHILKDKSSVLAYELINEPWAGDIYSNPSIFLPGFADQFNLLKLYDNVYPSIRKIDSDTLVMYEPVTWGTMSTDDIFGTGFDHPPGNDTKGTVLSWHFYCWLLEIEAINNINPLQNDTLPTFSREFCNDWQLNTYFNIVRYDLDKLGGGASFLTEFGWCSFQETNGKQNMEACNFVLDGSDKFLQSWTYWDSGTLFDDSLNPNSQYVDIFSRVYPLATNGIPTSLNYNSTTKEFEYLFTYNITSLNQAQIPTEITIPEFLYPNGFDVIVSDELQWSYDQNNYKILIYFKNDIIKQFITNENTIYSGQCFVFIKLK